MQHEVGCDAVKDESNDGYDEQNGRSFADRALGELEK